MRRTLILIAAALSGAAACDVAALNVCSETAKTTVNVGIAAGKEILCGALAKFEACFIASGSDCEASVKVTMQQEIQITRNYMTGKLGVECSGQGGTPVPLMSGDSGMPSGSVGHKSSASSAYGYLAWQLIMLILCICCCCIGGAGGGHYYTQQKKKGGKPKPRRQEYDAPREEVPLASVGVDVDGDGRIDAIVTGVDKDRDGIPDALEGDANAPAVVEVVEQAPLMAPYVEIEQPVLFGPMSPLLYPQQQTASTVVSAAPMASYGAYQQPTYAAYPSATSNYATGYPTTASNYASGYASAPMATGYAQSYASPAYATTGYAGGVV